MNSYQVVTILFALFAIGIDGWAVVAVARSTVLKYKPLWMIGSLFGFVGIGINWTKPDDIFLELGVQVPIIQVLYFIHTREVAAKVMFPIIAMVALIQSRTASEKSLVGHPKLDEAE
jgi:hypothetical protein